MEARGLHRMQSVFLGLIRLYQRWISPYKGFRCAYRVHAGGCSCSTLAYRAIRRHGVLRGLALLRERLGRCGDVHRRFHALPRRRGWPAAQRGDCDCGCDLPCHGGHCGAADLFDWVNCCDCGNCGSRRRADEPRRRRSRSR